MHCLGEKEGHVKNIPKAQLTVVDTAPELFKMHSSSQRHDKVSPNLFKKKFQNYRKKMPQENPSTPTCAI